MAENKDTDTELRKLALEKALSSETNGKSVSDTAREIYRFLTGEDERRAVERLERLRAEAPDEIIRLDKFLGPSYHFGSDQSPVGRAIELIEEARRQDRERYRAEQEARRKSQSGDA